MKRDNLVTTTNQLINNFDDYNIIDEIVEMWSENTQNMSVPESLSNELDDTESIGRFCLETVIATAFKTSVCNYIFDSDCDSISQLEEHIAELKNIYPAMDKDLYSWIFYEDVSEFDSTFYRDIPVYNSDEDKFGEFYNQTFTADDRKELGEFYTNKEIIEYILEKTVNSSDERMLDPGCGSGSFILERLKSQDITDFQNHTTECLSVGFDINPLAVEMARLRLLTFLYDKLDNKISFIPVFNIDTLEGSKEPSTDTIPEYSEIEADATNEIIEHQFRKQKLGKTLRDKMNYNAVVGNPPYVRIQNIPESKREKYDSKYHCKGNYDLSVLFIEYAVDVTPNGEVGYITSNKFLTSDYGEHTRKFIQNNKNIHRLIDIADVPVFDATVFPCIIILDSDNSDKIGYSILSKKPEKQDVERIDNLLLKIESNIEEDFYSNTYNYNENTIDIRCYLAELPDTVDRNWKLLSDVDKSIIEKMKHASNSLSALCTEINGPIKTNAKNVFVDGITSDFINEQDFERDIIKKAICGKNIEKWNVDWDTDEDTGSSYMIYPYKEVEGSATEIDLEKYPNIKTYLESHKDQLQSRSYLLENSNKNWYALGTQQSPDDFETEYKIVTPELSNENRFAIDTTGFYCISSAYSFRLKTAEPEMYKFIVGVLNSTPMEYYHKIELSTQICSKTFRYNKTYIKNLPIPTINTINTDINIDDIDINSVEDKSLLAGIIHNAVDSIMNNSAATNYEQLIDKATYKLFELESTEVNTVDQYMNFIK